MLRIEALDVPRGSRRVLHGVSLEIPPGEITTLLGPNGAGKSTLVLAVAGMLPATAGEVSVGDNSLTQPTPGAASAQPASPSCPRAAGSSPS